MIYRKALEELKKWRTSNRRKPLIVRGARQVGKTTVVTEFSKEFKQFISLNLEKPTDAQIFRGFRSMNYLIEELFFRTNQSIHEQDTLIFIDEIQQVPEAINLLRYFYEEYPQYAVIAAGSLLETILAEKVTIPVGRVSYMVIRPISFEEFLIAKGNEQAVAQFNKIPQDDFAFESLLETFHEYARIGGMPEVVDHYLNQSDLVQLNPIYEEILNSYMDDVDKYAKNQTMTQVLRHIIRNLGGEAGSRIKFQNFGHSNYRSREVGEAFLMLEKAFLVSLIYPTISSEIPIFNDRKKSPRLQMLDTGLLNYSAKIQNDYFRINDLSEVYKGKVIEHLVGQEILSSKYNVMSELNFWTREKKDAEAEIDYIILKNNYVIPIEIKAGATGRLRSLLNFMDEVKHPWAIRLYAGRITVNELKTPKGKTFYLLNLPYYLASKLEEYIEWLMSIRPE
ncbi:ATP-binding protein [Runella sp.]|uniref:ATP-binding protein n=1 Tax=Runella sp. TaxID=1960881 RepID=UPI00261AD219|nr:AAA family ATPase [Runella sp.]